MAGVDVEIQPAQLGQDLEVEGVEVHQAHAEGRIRPPVGAEQAGPPPAVDVAQHHVEVFPHPAEQEVTVQAPRRVVQRRGIADGGVDLGGHGGGVLLPQA
jgi:hypothetical protein